MRLGLICNIFRGGPDPDSMRERGCLSHSAATVLLDRMGNQENKKTIVVQERPTQVESSRIRS